MCRTTLHCEFLHQNSPFQLSFCQCLLVKYLIDWGGGGGGGGGWRWSFVDGGGGGMKVEFNFYFWMNKMIGMGTQPHLRELEIKPIAPPGEMYTKW